MARIIIVGSKEVDLDTPNPIKLMDSLSWMQGYEPNTPENLEVMEQLKAELRKRAYKVSNNHNSNEDKRYVMCMALQFPFKHAAKCRLKKGHEGAHFSNDRLGELRYWA